MEMNRKEVERSIAEEFGFTPEFYKALPDAVLPGAWSIHKHFELGETKLDGKTKELIGLSMASHIKCKYCIYFHSEAAKANGASEEEIREAIAMGGLTVLFSNCISGAQTDFDRFQQDVDRALEYIAKKAA